MGSFLAKPCSKSGRPFDLQLFASGAGLNRVFKDILTFTTGVTAMDGSTYLLTPLQNYGTAGVNDSGMTMNEAGNFTKWTFTLVPPLGTVAASGNTLDYSVTIYGTNNPTAYAAWKQAQNPGAYLPTPVVLPASSWFVLPGPSEQSGTGPIGNPLTAAAPVLTVSMPLLAVRAVVTGIGSPTISGVVAVQAVP